MEISKIQYRGKEINFKLGLKEDVNIKYNILGYVVINGIKKLALENISDSNKKLVSLPLDRKKYIRIYE